MKDTKDTNSQNKPKTPAKESPELRVVSIDFNPGPDAQDRLRRLFTPNPPKDTDGRREESGRGVRELRGK